jgi:Sulfatase
MSYGQSPRSCDQTPSRQTTALTTHETKTPKLRLVAADAGAALFGALAPARAADKKPNIAVIWGDDIGMWNVGAYTHGMMGRTPNIDSIVKDGILFTDHYGQPSRTAGCAAFITGQMPIRTGMTTIGIPGSPRGIQRSDPTIAEVLKSAGYATAQFGKTTWVTATSSCPPLTVSTNGSAIPIT